MNNPEAQREAARRVAERRQHQRDRAVYVGDGMVAAEVPGHQYGAEEARGRIPEKVPGRHRWIASGAWVLTDEAVRGVRDPDLPQLLDGENLYYLGVGCLDCEQPLGDGAPGTVTPDTVCRARGVDSPAGPASAARLPDYDGRTEAGPDDDVAVVTGWCATEEDLPGARQATHDILIDLMGDARRGPVTWTQYTGPEALEVLEVMQADRGEQLGGAPQASEDQYAQVRARLVERGGWVVMASAVGKRP